VFYNNYKITKHLPILYVA